MTMKRSSTFYILLGCIFLAHLSCGVAYTEEGPLPGKESSTEQSNNEESDGEESSEKGGNQEKRNKEEGNPEEENDKEDNPEEESDKAIVCEKLSLEQCADAGCRVVEATRYEAEFRLCKYPQEPVFCLSAGVVCADALTYARDLKGNTWQFGDSCLPEGWQVFEEKPWDRQAARGEEMCP